MNLASAFAVSAVRQGRKTAIYWGDQEHSYDVLHQQAIAWGALLRRDGSVQHGERVGLWLRNRPEFVPALFGIFHAGAVVVPISNFLKPEEIAFILADADIRVVITDAAAQEHLTALQALRPQVHFLRIEDFDAASDTGPAATGSVSTEHRSSDDLALIIYTSGTTGRPKGAMLTHANLLHNIDSCREVLKAVNHDRFVVLLPMFHSFMMTVGVLLPTIVGGSMVLIRSLHPPKAVLQEILSRQATILPAVPSFFRTLAGAPLPPGMPLRLCISGGAPLPVEVLREFNRTMPMPLIEGYGLSEASPVVSLNPIAGPWKEGSNGAPIPDVEVSVQDDEGRLLPVGDTGEICVRGGNVMRG